VLGLLANSPCFWAASYVARLSGRVQNALLGCEHLPSTTPILRVDGRPMTCREAVIRNLVKVAPPLLVLDTLIMLIAFGADKQRVSGKLAGTVVVRARAQAIPMPPGVRLA
jgi:hypothetical protein